jgi:hypothetical protein
MAAVPYEGNVTANVPYDTKLWRNDVRNARRSVPTTLAAALLICCRGNTAADDPHDMISRRDDARNARRSVPDPPRITTDRRWMNMGTRPNV